MIHDVTIPFSFDTSPIERQIASIGEGEVRKIVDKMVKKGIDDVMPTGYWDKEPNWGAYLKERVVDWLNDHKQEVIDEAALLLAARAGRTKAWRDVLDELREADNG